MREVPFQAMLFDISEDEKFTHFFYASTNSVVVKVGMSEDVDKRMKRDRQFKGHVLICKVSCDCPRSRMGGKSKCDREVAWENAHAASRLPASEQYRYSDDVYTALRFMCGRERRALAALEWFRQHAMPKSA